MATPYRVTWFVRLGNVITTALLRAGFRLGNMTLLTVRGRKSGTLRTTPVALGERNGQRFVMSPFGEVQWVRNLRAARTAVLSRGRSTETINVVELTPAEAAVILKDTLARAPSFLRQYFDVTPESSLADFEREAPRHPIFLIQP